LQLSRLGLPLTLQLYGFLVGGVKLQSSIQTAINLSVLSEAVKIFTRLLLLKELSINLFKREADFGVH
jgi:hypothetical protein